MDDIKIKNQYGDEIGKITFAPDIFPSVMLGILAVIAAIAAVLLPLFALQNMITGIVGGEEGAILTLLVIAVTVIVHTKIILKKEMYHTFGETWGVLIGSSTVTVSVICWIEALIKAKFEFGDIFIVPFAAALFSIFPTLAGALVCLIREIRENKRNKTP